MVSLTTKIRKEYKANGVLGVVRKGVNLLGKESSNRPVSSSEPKSYIELEERSKTPPDSDQLKSFQNKYKGKRCFIVGNGPSLNKLDLSKLDNEYRFAVNGIFYKTKEVGYKPTFYMVEDSHVINDNLEEINKFQPQIHRFFPTEYKNKLTDHTNTSFFTMNRGFYETKSPNFRIPRFSTDFAEKGYCGQSVTVLNLQLAFYMGFSEVYLIGMDFSYVIPESAKVTGLSIESTEDDENHFHPDYFGKGKKWHDPQLEQVLKNYEMAKMVYKWDGRKIMNATVGGNLNLFDRVDYNSLF